MHRKACRIRGTGRRSSNRTPSRSTDLCLLSWASLVLRHGESSCVAAMLGRSLWLLTCLGMCSFCKTPLLPPPCPSPLPNQRNQPLPAISCRRPNVTANFSSLATAKVKVGRSREDGNWEMKREVWESPWVLDAGPYLGRSCHLGRVSNRCSRHSGSCLACCSIFGCTSHSAGCIR